MKKFSIFVLAFMCLSYNAYGQINFVSGKQFGTEQDDVSYNVLTDSLNNVYLVGETSGLIGEKQFGGKDGLICKFDSIGNMLWSKQIGSQYNDKFSQAQFDEKYNVYLTGFYSKVEKDKDVWVLKLNSEGEMIWQKTFGTDSTDIGRDITVDKDGTVYIIGQSNGNFGENSSGDLDCFILCLNNEGEQQRIVQFGSRKADQGSGITIGADSLIYVCGSTYGDISQQNLGKLDAFWGTFTKELNQQKIIQFGTSGYDAMYHIQTDSENNIIIVGTTGGEIGTAHFGHQDAYLRKMDHAGNVLWQKQFGTKKGDYINGLVIYKDDNILISGCQNWPNCQAFCRMYNKEGELLWKNNYVAMGKEHGTCGKGICINKNGYIYHTGATDANLFSDPKGKHDMYLLKLKLDINKNP